MSDSEPPITIRPGCANDASQVHALIQPYVERDLLLERSVEEIAALAQNSFAAECEGVVIGFAAVEIYSTKLAEVQCLAVSRGFQHRGVGRQLVARCVDIAAENNVRELMAISSSDDFLMTCGFHYSLPGQKRALFINP